MLVQLFLFWRRREATGGSAKSTGFDGETRKHTEIALRRQREEATGGNAKGTGVGGNKKSKSPRKTLHKGGNQKNFTKTDKLYKKLAFERPGEARIFFYQKLSTEGNPCNLAPATTVVVVAAVVVGMNSTNIEE